MRTGMVLLLIGLFFGCTAAEIRRHSSKPNIILIMADDAGVEAFGCYGGQSYPTPVIDGLATSGVRFTNCHSQPLCTPSRVKIMTGMSNIRNYKYFSILDPELETFGPMLKSAGYVTAAVVIVGFATLATMSLVFLLSLQLRRREIQTMMRIGGSRGRIVAILAMEVLGVLVIGVGLAGVLATLTNEFGETVIRAFILRS